MAHRYATETHLLRWFPSMVEKSVLRLLVAQEITGKEALGFYEKLTTRGLHSEGTGPVARDISDQFCETSSLPCSLAFFCVCPVEQHTESYARGRSQLTPLCPAF